MNLLIETLKDALAIDYIERLSDRRAIVTLTDGRRIFIEAEELA
jgi:hypothetical protein